MYSRIFLAVALSCAGLQAQVAIVNNASFRGDQPVSSGTWVAAFGTFTGVTTTTATGFPLSTSLAGVKVTVDGVDAPMYYVGTTQITFIVPYETKPGLRTVVITTPSGTVNGSVRVMSTSPGLFAKDLEKPPRGAIRNQDGFTENSSSTPAHRGDIVSFYGTGPGALDHATPNGAAPGVDPLIRSRSTPQVFVGGVDAEVQFSGLNPDVPGLWQINVVIPNLPFITGRVPVIVYMDGVDSNEVTVFVR